MPEPAAPSSKVAPGDAVELAVAGSGTVPAETGRADSWILARLAGAEPGALYISARSFRC